MWRQTDRETSWHQLPEKHCGQSHASLVCIAEGGTALIHGGDGERRAEGGGREEVGRRDEGEEQRSHLCSHLKDLGSKQSGAQSTEHTLVPICFVTTG